MFTQSNAQLFWTIPVYLSTYLPIHWKHSVPGPGPPPCEIPPEFSDFAAPPASNDERIAETTTPRRARAPEVPQEERDRGEVFVLFTRMNPGYQYNGFRIRSSKACHNNIDSKTAVSICPVLET